MRKKNNSVKCRKHTAARVFAMPTNHHSASPPPPPAADNTPCTTSLIEALHADALECVLTHLPPPALLAAGAACRALATSAEHVFRLQHCQPQGWRPPRRPRGEAAAVAFFPWRAVWLRNACSSCAAQPGEFQAWRSLGGGASARVAGLCGVCVRRRAVVEALRRVGARVDLVSTTGRSLLMREDERRARGGGGRRQEEASAEVGGALREWGSGGREWGSGGREWGGGGREWAGVASVKNRVHHAARGDRGGGAPLVKTRGVSLHHTSPPRVARLSLLCPFLCSRAPHRARAAFHDPSHCTHQGRALGGEREAPPPPPPPA